MKKQVYVRVAYTCVAAFLELCGEFTSAVTNAQSKRSVERIQFPRRHDSSIVCGAGDGRSGTLSRLPVFVDYNHGEDP